MDSKPLPPDPPPPRITTTSPSNTTTDITTETSKSMPPSTAAPGSSGSASSVRSNGSVVTGTSTPSRTPRSGTPFTAHTSQPAKHYKLHEKTGYTDTSFPGKEKQLKDVIKALKSKGFIPDDLVDNEVPFLREPVTSCFQVNSSERITVCGMDVLFVLYLWI